MVLCVDIGNTNISFGLCSGARLIFSFDVPRKDYSRNRIASRLPYKKISVSIICSVVPTVGREVKKHLFTLTGKKTYEVGRNIDVGIKNLYRNPSQVGQDRLVNAFAGVHFYGFPLIIVDFGTAITLDVVSKKREYMGGMILPGIGISLDALNKNTALLPKVKLGNPRELIGRDTKTSILSGIVHGLTLSVDGLVTMVKKELGCSAKVIATGGNIKFISRFFRNYDIIDKNLTLKGLNLLASLIDM